MPPICLHFKKTVKSCQYGYQMKGLDVGVKNMWFVYRFSSFFTFYEYTQTNVNKTQFSEFTAKPYEYGYQMKAHDEKITNMMSFRLLYCLCFSDVNKLHDFLTF